MLSDSARRIIIGDVHGHFQGLQNLFSLLNLTDQDAVYFLGDLIDRGPESAQVVEFVRTHEYPCLLGNHEQMMLTAYELSDSDYFAMEGWLSAGGRSTVDSYLDANEQLALDLKWMATLPTYIDLGDLWLVHAGVQEPFFEDKLIVTGHTITFTFPEVEPGQIAQGAGWLDIDTGAYHPRSGWLTAFDATQQQVYQVNVYDGSTRIRPLEEAITPIQPMRPRMVSPKKLLFHSA
jgi:serine/threonine protein phosphatase 1